MKAMAEPTAVDHAAEAREPCRARRRDRRRLRVDSRLRTASSKGAVSPYAASMAPSSRSRSTAWKHRALLTQKFRATSLARVRGGVDDSTSPSSLAE